MLKSVRGRLEDLERVVAKLMIIENRQAFIFPEELLCSSEAAIYTSPPSAYSHMKNLARFDDVLVAALAAVTNIRFGENSSAQVALPVCLGGLGIRMAKDNALPACISSLHAVRELVDGILNNTLLSESNDLLAAEREWDSGVLSLRFLPRK